MIKAAVIFAGGALFGAWCLPASIVYIKPVRTKIATSFATFATEKLRDEPETREEALNYAKKFIALVEQFPEESSDTSNVKTINKSSALVYLKDCAKVRTVLEGFRDNIERGHTEADTQAELEFVEDILSQLDDQGK